eukprot:comp27851_c0_seq1/m.47180 comp27851_c0_seq1/g.47180  ORF comp27851_c0_seq1/g.47180 comp27851_c0_seq1/m.47180 type:complete len:197 (-) comp27851_c0_seq1:77-667(-)
MSVDGLKSFRICVVGSGGVGKSCVTLRLLKNKFAEYYDPTIEEGYRKVMEVDSVTYNLEIVDTAGQEEFASFRDCSLDYGDGFLLVYSILSSSSWDELKDLHTKILRIKDKDNCPCVVIGNKKDLDDKRTVSQEEAAAFCKQINCPYLETSAKTGENVYQSFEQVVREVVKQLPPEESHVNTDLSKKKKKSKCTIL